MLVKIIHFTCRVCARYLVMWRK